MGFIHNVDRALVWARRQFRRERLGQVRAEDLPQRTKDFLQANPSLEFIDVTEAVESTTGNGHAYLRKSPWFSSDLLAFLSDPVFLSHHIHHFNSSFLVNPVEKTSRSFLIGF